jgi:hypothetical protein
MRLSAVSAIAIICLMSWLHASPAAADDSSPAPLQHITFWQAPAQVRRGLVRTLGRCAVPAKVVRNGASFYAGPIGGPGQDYLFSFPQSYPRQARPHALETDSCNTNHDYFLLWMRARGGGYRLTRMDGADLYVGRSAMVVFNPDTDCDLGKLNADAWWDCGRFLAWGPAASAFRPLTKDMTWASAAAWAKARDYQRILY